MKFIKPHDLLTRIPLKYRNYASFGPYNIPIFGKMYFGRIKSIIKTFLQFNKSFQKILDIGGGFGLFSLNFKLNFPRSELYIFDKMLIEEIKEFLTGNHILSVKDYIQGDIEEKTKFSNDNFDVIFALDVLEHLNNPYVALDEILRILKVNGLLFISVPIEGKILRVVRTLIGKVKNIEVNPHWEGSVHSEEEFFEILKKKKFKIIFRKNYPFRSLPKMFSYDKFYLIQKTID